ncbi:aminotransferase class I/II-fold pyridoxal phosphate-dependent enzyme [Pelagibacterales bacterium SAG-MED20]|nr:aminotransferase class I/II-fold pyridoxal phosphate-dependent enzyme [Pelagibacterales bacterium SAG-MED20]
MTISYGKQSIDSQDIRYVVKSLKSNYLTQGPLVKEFEKELTKNFKCKFSTVLSNASSALFLIGKILKWKKGDLIAVPPITFISSINSVEHCGAKPLFIDINLDDYCMDPFQLEKELEKDKKKRIKAAIITDYGGQPAQWKKFHQLKKKYNITLINDNCHAMGSSIQFNKGYATKYADFATLSFHPVKAITTGEGGAILTNNKIMNEKATLLREHGIVRNNSKHWDYKVFNLGYNFRLPDLNCALGISQLKKLNKFTIRRIEISQIYDNLFNDKEKFRTPKKIKNTINTYHLYPLLINLKKIKKTKEKIIKEFLKYKIKLQVHYIPVNTQPFYKRKYGFNKNNYKNSSLFFKSCISLPIYYDLKETEINHIKKICKKVFKI